MCISLMFSNVREMQFDRGLLKARDQIAEVRHKETHRNEEHGIRHGFQSDWTAKGGRYVI